MTCFLNLPSFGRFLIFSYPGLLNAPYMDPAVSQSAPSAAASAALDIAETHLWPGSSLLAKGSPEIKPSAHKAESKPSRTRREEST